MRIGEDKLREIISDLGINVPFIKGQDIKVQNCWHYYTEGPAIDTLFYGEEDFRDGMNRVFLTLRNYDVVILAFVLMDTHVHFILHGTSSECNKFVHEYIRRTSMYIEGKHKESKKLLKLPISFQAIDTDRYLKTAICYVIKNPTTGGLPCMFYDYPWSSGSLYFRKKDTWTSPKWTIQDMALVMDTASTKPNSRVWRNLLKTSSSGISGTSLIEGTVFPGDFVAYEIVEQLFRTQKSFMYFVSSTKESDIESRGGYISSLSLPDNEIRQHKNELCQKLFGISDTHKLDTEKRVLLAHQLKSKYNSSIKQIARICGLKYDEIKNFF